MVGTPERLTPTDTQRRVADPSRSAWVVANAGTGKTRVLTDRVLRLLLAGADPQGILGITFTRAAAAEMTARIERRLAAWATIPDEALAGELEILTGTPPDAATLDRARQLFARVLELPQGLQIQTIHAFCGALLRRFPLEAGIPPHFETADEGKALELFAEAREQVLERAARDPEGRLGRALMRLATAHSDGSLFDALAELRRARIRLAETRARFGGLEGLLRTLADALGIQGGRTADEILVEACTDAALDRTGLERVVSWWRTRGTNRQKRAAEVLEAWLSRDVEDRIAGLDTLRQHVFRRESWAVNGNYLRDRGFVKHDEAVIYRTEAERWQRVHDEIRAVETFTSTEALLTLGFEVLDTYERLLRREGLLDFDDLVATTRRLLTGRVDWVLYKLDARIDHILVDEAQDTSPAQWEIVEALLEEFLAGEGARSVPRTFFVVGDEKQSIYSFQGADVENFRRVRERLLERARAARHPAIDGTLALSFRSTEAVLRLVDRLFAEIPEAAAGVLVGDEKLVHRAHRAGEPGMVELWPLVRPKAPEIPEEPWPLPEPRPSADPEPRLAEAVAATIADWLARGERLEARGRPVRPGDILILVRRRGVIQEMVVRALKRRGVSVAGVDRMRLAEHLAVRDLVALGRAVLLPEDDYTLACLLKSPLLGLDEQALFTLAHDRKGMSLLARLRARAAQEGPDGPFAIAWARFERWRARADFVPPYEFYAWVLGAEGGRARLLERLGPDAAEPIEAFLARALAFEEGHPAGLEGFLHWFELGSGELARDPEKGADAVRVTTVHGAKGLEAPVVFLLDAGPRGTPRERDPLLWIETPQGPLPAARSHKGARPSAVAKAAEREARLRQEEENRLLYVALTRAADRLIVAGWSRGRGDSADTKSWHGWIRRTLEGMDGVERRPAPAGLEGEVLVWRCGQAAGTGAPAAAAGEVDAAASPTPLPAWVFRPAPTERGAQSPCAPTRLVGFVRTEEEPDEEPPPFSADREAARYRRGLALHALFQHLPEIPPRHRPQAARRLLAQLAPDLAQAWEELLGEVERVLALPELAPAFGPRARREQPIAGRLDPDGRPVLGRVDRFALEHDRVLLVDFKTHRRVPEGRVPQEVLAQMRAYAQVLRGIYPDRRIEAAVVWTALPRVDLLSPAQLGLDER